VGERPKTRWGDREQRRADILAAARSEVVGRGYLGFAMRDVATGAGISPGSLYSYFATKEDIFAALFAERLDELHAEVALVCARADDLRRLLVEVSRAYLPVYGDYGEHFDIWALTQQLGADELPAVARDLAEPAARILASVGAALRRLGALDAFDEQDRDYVMPFLWMTLTGMAAHFTGSRHLLHPYSVDDLSEFAADMLTAALRQGRVSQKGAV
jgi:AcrR family transcriptional regulator